MTNEEAIAIIKAAGVREFLVVANGIPAKRRLFVHQDSIVCEMRPRSRNKGIPISVADIAAIKPIAKQDPAIVWRRSWNKVESILLQSGLWPEVLKEVQDGLQIDYENIRKACAIEWAQQDEGLIYAQMCDKRHAAIVAIDPRLDSTLLRDQMSRPARIKAMCFSKNPELNQFHKQQIAEALKDNKPLSIDTRVSYDVRFDYEPKYDMAFKPKPGRPSYAEEYKGCGNGHYYIAISATHALFMEDD